MTRILEAEQQAEARLQAADEAAEQQLRAAREKARRLLVRADARLQAVRRTHASRLADSMQTIEMRRELARREAGLGGAEAGFVKQAVHAMADELLGTEEAED
jgi:vacuolar-type H+-ATPase subunit H